MTAIDRALSAIRRHETPLTDRLYRLAKALRAIHMPVIPVLHHMLYEERRVRLGLWQRIARMLYYEPLFRTQCVRVGRNLRLIGGIPLLLGNRIRIFIGDDVTISGITTFAGSLTARDPMLSIGRGTSIGYQTTILTGQEVRIGEHVLIGNRVLIAGHDREPSGAEHDPGWASRSADGTERTGVWIEDLAWIGEGAVILKGVRVGKGAVVAAHAVVTQEVPPFSVAAGNPARIIKRLVTEIQDCAPVEALTLAR
jgi:acetyltransferase-like isoleucine patch superfamily enzyme